MSSPRHPLISAVFTQENLDALLVLSRPDLRYLCGFTGTDGVLILTRDQALFLTDSRYQQQARTEVTADAIVCYQEKLQAVVEHLTSHGCQRIAFDARHLNVARYFELKNRMESAGMTLIPLSDELAMLRAVKTDEEIRQLKKVADLNHQAFTEVLPLIKPGVPERQIALELEFALKQRGGHANAFDFIVASGQRGALPHGVASDKKIATGELVTIDFGTCLSGYHSDETVTLAVGEIDRNLRQIFDIVLEAHDLALAAVRPEMRISDLDAVAREFISSKGYGQYFGHGLGHGVGLEVHESPTISSRNEDLLQAGMVITIEPGIYVPAVGGVRIEDTIVVTRTGYQCLTSIPKELRLL